jgi:hypothetical protein
MRTGYIFSPREQKSVWVNVNKGELRQPNYSRGPHTVATSKGLLGFRSCIAEELSGKKPGNRKAVRENFRGAAKKCAGKA